MADYDFWFRDLPDESVGDASADGAVRGIKTTAAEVGMGHMLEE